MVVIRSIAVILCFLLPAAAQATTYEYTGSPYTTYTFGATPELFGTNMTALVTIDGDTTDASGKFTWTWFPDSTISFVQITSGTYSVTDGGVGSGSYVILDHGAISQWSLTSSFGMFCGAGGPAYVRPCVMQTVDVSQSAASGEFIDQVCEICGPTLVKGNNQAAEPLHFGTWSTVAPVPAPVLGSGVSGLALLVAFFVSRSASWRRRTKKTISTEPH